MMEMPWTEVRDAVEANALVLLPLGVIEEHGPHLCLGTDTFTAEISCRHIAAQLEESGIPTIIAPPFSWGICQATEGFIGSFRIRKETAKSLLFDILSTLADFGFKEAYGISGHGDIEHNIMILETFKEANAALPLGARFCFGRDIFIHYGVGERDLNVCPVPPSTITVGNPREQDIHAGDMETAVMAQYYPEFTRSDIAKGLPPVRLENERYMEWMFSRNMAAFSKDGYLGDPAFYGSVDVQAHLEELAQRFSDAIRAVRATN